MNRRNVLAAMVVFSTGGLLRTAAAADTTSVGGATNRGEAGTNGSRVVHVMKRASCGCCNDWVAHLHSFGFDVTTRDLSHSEMLRFKARHGITSELASCHTARVDGYTIEGHVPARELSRLLHERPDAVGLAVPDMPIGSPGMERGDRVEPYDVLLIKGDGSTEVYASYAAQG